MDISLTLNMTIWIFRLFLKKAQNDKFYKFKAYLKFFGYFANAQYDKWCGFFAFLQKAQNDKGLFVILSAAKYPNDKTKMLKCDKKGRK